MRLTEIPHNAPVDVCGHHGTLWFCHPDKASPVHYLQIGILGADGHDRQYRLPVHSTAVTGRVDGEYRVRWVRRAGDNQ